MRIYVIGLDLLAKDFSGVCFIITSININGVFADSYSDSTLG